MNMKVQVRAETSGARVSRNKLSSGNPRNPSHPRWPWILSAFYHDPPHPTTAHHTTAASETTRFSPPHLACARIWHSILLREGFLIAISKRVSACRKGETLIEVLEGLASHNLVLVLVAQLCSKGHFERRFSRGLSKAGCLERGKGRSKSGFQERRGEP